MKVYKVNAFTYRGMGGNGAGVVRCIDFPPPEVMQGGERIGLFETVLSVPLKGLPQPVYTPECEVPTCGHATIAAFSCYRYWGN